MNLYKVTCSYYYNSTDRVECFDVYVVASDPRGASDTALNFMKQKKYIYNYVSKIELIAGVREQPYYLLIEE